MPSSPIPQILANPSTLGTWFSLNLKLLDGAEIIENKLHLYHDNAVRYSISNDHEFRELRPEPDRQIFTPKNGEILLNGDSLEGDTAGNLQIGIYHKNLTYPLEIIDIKLSDSFHIEMKLVSTSSSLEIHHSKPTNPPKNGSKSYPYKLQYSVMTSKQDSWEDTDIIFKNSSNFRIRLHNVLEKKFVAADAIGPASKLLQSFRQSPGFKFRLISSTGKTHLLGAVSKFDDVILLENINQKLVPVADWISQPNFYDIPYEIYSFDPSTGKEEWKPYPKMRAEIANQHLDFSNIGLEVKDVSMHKSRDGQHLQGSVSLTLDVALDNETMEELADTIQFRYSPYGPDFEQTIISNSHSLIDPKNISLNLKIKSQYFHFLIYMDYFTTPNNLETIELPEIKFEFISRNGKTLECLVHPEFLTLKKKNRGPLVRTDPIVCPSCNRLQFSPFCECGWKEGESTFLGYSPQEYEWYTDVKHLNNRNFQFVLHDLSPGEYSVFFHNSSSADWTE